MRLRGRLVSCVYKTLCLICSTVWGWGQQCLLKHIQFSHKYYMTAHTKYHQDTLLNPRHTDFFLESLRQAFLSSQLTLALNLPESLLAQGLSLQKASIQLLLVDIVRYLFKGIQCGPKLWTGNILIRLVKARGSKADSKEKSLSLQNIGRSWATWTCQGDPYSLLAK